MSEELKNVPDCISGGHSAINAKHKPFNLADHVKLLSVGKTNKTRGASMHDCMPGYQDEDYYDSYYQDCHPANSP